MVIDFDAQHACDYGLSEAALIALLRGWIAEKRAKGENFREGRTWFVMSLREMSERVGFLTEKQLRGVLGSLLFQRVIVMHSKGVVQYAFADESRFLPSMGAVA